MRTQPYVPVVAVEGGQNMILGVCTLDADTDFADTDTTVEIDGTEYPLQLFEYTSIVTGQLVQYMGIPVDGIEQRSGAYGNYKRFASITSMNPGEERWRQPGIELQAPDTRTQVDKFLYDMTNDMKYVAPPPAPAPAPAPGPAPG